MVPPWRLLALPVIVVLLAATRAHAHDEDEGQRVHRCVGVHGEVVFSGLSCDAGEQAGISAGAIADPAEPPPADSCPGSLQELRERLGAAIARHDANAIAGMLHWRGIGASVAGQRLRELRELVREPLLALESNDGLLVRTGGSATGGVREHAFGVETEGGCYWLGW